MNERTLTSRSRPALATPAGAWLRRSCACGSRVAFNGPCAQCAATASAHQGRLAIGARTDPRERLAERLADGALAGRLQTLDTGVLRRSAGEGMSGGTASGMAPASVDRVLSAAGSPLAPPVRIEMEQRFGHDFSRVRVHAGADADRSAREVGANAYTVGSHIAFAAGRFAPATPAGRHLLAHELAHVVQQGNGAPPLLQRDSDGGGSTEFKNTVSSISKPAGGSGIIQGIVDRTEIAPAGGGKPAQAIHFGQMSVHFDPSDCAITIPISYQFMQAPAATGKGICDEPPASTAVPPLAADAFNRIKAGLLADVNRGLNGWFDVRLSGGACPGGCAGKPLPIRVVASESTTPPTTSVTIVNRGGRADSGTVCAQSWNPTTAVHEAGHQGLGLGDEYPETDERLRAVVPGWFRPERVRRDYSIMGPDEHSRFAMFHERHFRAVAVFLEHAYPGCKATLSAQPRPVVPDFRVTMGSGYASIGGKPGTFFAIGLSAGIPLDRLRRWELVLGPQLSGMMSSGSPMLTAFLLGARVGLERSTGGSGHGFTAGVYGGAGYGSFSAGSGASALNAKSAYGEIGASAGYRTPLFGASTRLDVRITGGFGSTLGAPGVIGPPPDIASDPARSHWFQLGLQLGAQF